jgi:molybdopterin-guanine dinucleotide biosynthesis protein A
MAGAKPSAVLAGRPLVSYPLAALAEVCDRVAVVCKSSTELPALDGVERWDEPDEPQHPLTGIVHALETAGEPVLVCAADMPFITPDGLRTLLTPVHSGTGTSSPVVIATSQGELQPVVGVYAPAALDHLRAAPPDEPLTRTVEGLSPTRVALPPLILRNVNTPEELAEAEEALR